MKVTNLSLKARLKSSGNSPRRLISMSFSSTRSLQVSGRTRMSRKVSSLSYSVASVKNSNQLVEVGSEVKSIFYSAVILLLLSLSYSSTFTRLPPEVFILQARVVQLSVLPSTSLRILRQRKSYSNQELLSSLTVVFAASMSLIRWMITQGTSFTKLWSNKPSQSLKLVLFVR